MRITVTIVMKPHLKNSFIAEEQVGCFYITVKYPVIVKMGHGTQKLNHECLNLT